ncbi:MAG: glycosyltransferase family 4 protein, partial [Gammaproteobacteria bacterium]|nr:glycosyltransferase family 4 protein [Gammaproteobacteria bacterium]
ERLVQRFERCHATERPAAWVTYHLYHKAPDWLGPVVAAALDIPYLVVEASHAPKQAGGPWAMGFAAAAQAICAADRVVALNSNDLPGLMQLRPHGVVFLPPFVSRPAPLPAAERTATRTALAHRYHLPAAQPWLITVAMMRADSKLASYQLLARALRSITDTAFTLIVIGDGPARRHVLDAFRDFANHRVCWLGALHTLQINRWLAVADLFVWPAVNEAYGMALLEAQACGLPVVAGRIGGVPDIVQHTQTGLLVDREPIKFAEAVRHLLRDPDRRHRMGANARRKVEAAHSIHTAHRFLHDVIVDSIADRVGETVHDHGFQHG